MANYKFGKTIWKGIKAVLQFLLPVILIYLQTTGVADKKILDLVVQFLPWLGSLTIGGVIVAITNYVKHH